MKPIRISLTLKDKGYIYQKQFIVDQYGLNNPFLLLDNYIPYLISESYCSE